MRRLALLLSLLCTVNGAAWAVLIENGKTKVPWCYLGPIKSADGMESQVGSRMWELFAREFSPKAWDKKQATIQWARISTILAQTSDVSGPAEVRDPCALVVPAHRSKDRRKEKSKGKATPVIQKNVESPWKRQFEKTIRRIAGGELYSAETELDDLIAEYPEVARFQLARAGLMELLGRTAEKQAAYEKALDLDPEVAKSSATLCEQSLGRKESCVKFGAEPGNWLAYAFRGIERVRQKDCERGILDLQRATLLDPPYKAHADYFIRLCPHDAAPAAPVEATPGNPFPERAEDQKVTTTPP